jgi:hypothetical protein
MRIQSREKTTVMEYMKNIAQWELNTWGDNWWNMRREFSGSSKCATGMCTGRGGDFCGYNDRTSGRWRTTLLPTEDGIGIIHKMKLAQGPYFEVSLESGSPRCWRGRAWYFMQLVIIVYSGQRRSHIEYVARSSPAARS